MRIRCAERGLALRAIAERDKYAPTVWPVSYRPADRAHAVAHSTAWNAHAAGEIPRPVVHNAVDIEALAPEYALEAWHRAAGAIITPMGCDCDSPAGHRDALVKLARQIESEVRYL